MPSLMTHLAVPVAARIGLGPKIINTRLLVLCSVVSILPDADVIAFKFGIPYASQWGHRGFMHSIFFAACIALFSIFLSKYFKARKSMVFTAVLLSALSHPLLDAFTDGGLGVALYWPFSDNRIFFPWHPIKVSPISIRRFLSERGILVLRSEFIWVWLPSILSGFAVFLSRLVMVRILNTDPLSKRKDDI